MKIGERIIRGSVALPSSPPSIVDLHHDQNLELQTCDRYGHIIEETNEQAENFIQQGTPSHRTLLDNLEEVKAEKFN